MAFYIVIHVSGYRFLVYLPYKRSFSSIRKSQRGGMLESPFPRAFGPWFGAWIGTVPISLHGILLK